MISYMLELIFTAAQSKGSKDSFFPQMRGTSLKLRTGCSAIESCVLTSPSLATPHSPGCDLRSSDNGSPAVERRLFHPTTAVAADDSLNARCRRAILAALARP